MSKITSAKNGVPYCLVIKIHYFPYFIIFKIFIKSQEDCFPLPEVVRFFNL